MKLKHALLFPLLMFTTGKALSQTDSPDLNNAIHGIEAKLGVKPDSVHISEDGRTYEAFYNPDHPTAYFNYTLVDNDSNDDGKLSEAADQYYRTSPIAMRTGLKIPGPINNGKTITVGEATELVGDRSIGQFQASMARAQQN